MSLFVFLIKSTACLALFLLFYKLVLEQERMHVFKRFYLLAALLLSFVIPSITFTEYIEIASVPEETILMDRTVSEEVRLSPDSPEAEVTSTTASTVQDITDHWPVLLWSLYGIGVFVFFLKFLRTLWTIGRNIRSNPKIKLGKTINVLLGDAVVPHTFFNYIFLNRKDYEDKRIADEVLLHERTHARQIHSLDVLFVELLQIVFWFDPLIYLTKKSIKLNHEFLADQAVLERGASTATYQKILLAFASSATGHNNQSSLANAINYSSYSSIKKRFTVMRTQTSRKSVLLRSILLLPLLAILLYSFSETKTIRKEKTNSIDGTRIYGPPSITDTVKKDTGTEKIENRSVELAGLVFDSETLKPLKDVEIYSSGGGNISRTDVNGYYKIIFDDLNQGEILFEFTIQKKGYKSILQKEHWGNLKGKIKSAMYFGLNKKGVESPEINRLVPFPKNIDYESIEAGYKSIEPEFELDVQLENLKRGNQNILFEIDKNFYLVNDSGWIKLHSKNDLVTIDDYKILPAYQLNSFIERREITGMTPLENRKALFAIFTNAEMNLKNSKEKASEEELSQFYMLAEKYNAIPISERVIPLNNLRILETIYQKMTGMQRVQSLPFPKCLLKNTGQEGATKKQMNEYNALAKKYNIMLAKKGNIRIEKSEIERLEYLHALMTDSQRAEAEPFPDFPEPPAPPSPPMPPDQSSVGAEEIALSRLEKREASKDERKMRGQRVLTENQKAQMERQAEKLAEQSAKMQENASRMKTQQINIEEQMEEMETRIQQIIDNQEIIVEGTGNINLMNYALPQEPSAVGVSEYPVFSSSNGEVEMKGETPSTPPAPPTPPKPKSPLELLQELKNENAKIIFNGEEISYEQAEKLFQENTFSRVNLKKQTGKRPILKVRTN